MARKLITAPDEEPVTVDEAAKHLHIDSDIYADEEELIYIESLITAARQHCESFQARCYITQTWDLYLDEFPESGEIELPGAPLQSVTWLKYKDSNGTLQTLDSGDYIVDTITEPGRIVLAYGESWPTLYAEIQAIQIRYIAGYGDASAVPIAIKHAILLKLTDLYEHRGEDPVDESISGPVEALLWPDRIVSI